MADPWVTLAAVAMATARVTIGPLITPLPRRRPHQLARETVTLDRLSGGRLILGVGVGSERHRRVRPARFGEEGDMRERARLLDDGLERLVRYWDGEFEPRPVQRPRIPVWVGGRWPRTKPMRAGGALGRLVPDRRRQTPDDVREMRAALGDEFPIIVTNAAGRGLRALGRGRARRGA